MIGMGVVAKVAGTVLNGVTGVFQKREERKLAKVSAQGKIALAKQNNAANISMSRAEWETVMAKNTADSWKDEFALIVILMPIICIFLGALYAAYTGDDRILKGVNEALLHFEKIGLEYGMLVMAVVLASFGIRWMGK